MLFSEVIKLPLSLEQLQLVLETKGKDEVTNKINLPLMARVSYKESTLKDSHFVNYVSNLNLCVLIDDKDLSKEEKFGLLKAYMGSRVLSQVHTLSDEGAALLLTMKGVECEGESFLTTEEKLEFIQDNKELLTKYELFLESILIGLPFVIKEYAAGIGKELIESGLVEVVNDPSFISSNVVSMIMTEGFLEFYLSLQLKHQPKLFESQWFEPVFNGHNLINIITNHSSLFPFMQALHDGWFTAEELEAIKVG